ncbi:MAG: glycerol kinase GlpK [Motiliproteus sp.]
MNPFILAIDQGTTSSRALLVNAQGAIHGSAQQAFPQYFPEDGWVEHEPEELWQSVLACCRQVMAQTGIGADQIAAIGITNQRETTLVWDRHSGEPLYRAIVWQDRRTADYCQQLQQQGLEAQIREKTGLLLDPYFSATKIRWILDQVPGAREKSRQGQLAFGTVDCFLLWKLTAGRVHRTDATNASRTLLFNIHNQCWDDELLRLFDIPTSMLPQVMDSADDFGVTEAAHLGGAIPILGVAGDQQAALFGQACFSPGMAKSTYGTGCFLMLNTGAQALPSEHRLLTTLAYRLDGKVTYALEGSVFIAGAALQWLRDGLKLIATAGDSEGLAVQTPLDHGVYLVPAFTGLGAPYWDPRARGAIVGLSRDTGIKEIVTAALQAVCYQTRDLQQAMHRDGVLLTTLRVDGGMVGNNWLMQFLADMLDASVERPQISETTGLGAAYLAGLQAGVFASLEQLEALWQCQHRYQPEISAADRDRYYAGWEHAVRRVQCD